MTLRSRAKIILYASGCLTMMAAELAAAQNSDIGSINTDQRTAFEKEALYQSYQRNELLYGAEWYHSRGYGYVKNESYGAYKEAELLALARAGDPVAEVIAVNKLSPSAVLDDKLFRELVQFHESAVVNGYNSTFMWIIEAYQFRARQTGGRANNTPATAVANSPLIDTLVSDSAKEDSIKALIWTLVAQMRGDPQGDKTAGGFESYGLTEMEGRRSCDLANQIYAKLNEARQDRGYPAFSTDLPTLANTDMSDFGSLCKTWPVRRLTCSQQKVHAGMVPLSGYRCKPVGDS